MAYAKTMKALSTSAPLEVKVFFFYYNFFEYLRGIDTTVCSEVPYSLKGSKFFPFKVDPFSEGISCAGEQTERWQKIHQMYQVPFPVSILRKSTTDRYRPVRVADGPITARCRFK